MIVEDKDERHCDLTTHIFGHNSKFHAQMTTNNLKWWRDDINNVLLQAAPGYHIHTQFSMPGMWRALRDSGFLKAQYHSAGQRTLHDTRN